MKLPNMMMLSDEGRRRVNREIREKRRKGSWEPELSPNEILEKYGKECFMDVKEVATTEELTDWWSSYDVRTKTFNIMNHLSDCLDNPSEMTTNQVDALKYILRVIKSGADRLRTNTEAKVDINYIDKECFYGKLQNEMGFVSKEIK